MEWLARAKAGQSFLHKLVKSCLMNVFNTNVSAFEYYYTHICNCGDEVMGRDKLQYKQLLNESFRVEDPSSIEYPEWRHFSTKYHEDEIEWYLTGSNHISHMRKYKIWRDIANSEGNVNSNYGHHWRGWEQRRYMEDSLTENIHSRRAVMTVFDGKLSYDYDLNGNDWPCTTAVQLFYDPRINAICLTVNMRSCDLVFGFCYDILWWNHVLNYYVKELHYNKGYIHMNITNFHIYENHYKLHV